MTLTPNEITLTPNESASEVFGRLADEIQAEVDEKYVPRVGAAYQMLADPKLDDEAVNSAYEILKEYGTLDAYIDKFYLPRLLFEDGEPVQFGDEYLGNDGIARKVTSIRIFDDGLCWVFGGGVYHCLTQDERLKRPPEPDTQEKIEEECHRLAYVVSQAGTSRTVLEDGIRDLLARQRKLDGVE